MSDARDLLGRASGTEDGRHHGRHPHWRRRRRRGRLTLAVVCLLLLAGGAAAYLGMLPLVRQLTAPDDYPGPGTGVVSVQINEGDSGRTIGRGLQEAGVVLTAKAFVAAAKAEPKMAQIQPGTYTLRRQMSAAEAVQLLLDPGSRSVTRLVVPEGKRATQVLDLIAQHTAITRRELDALAADPAALAALGLPPAADGKLEGFLFPATYEIEPKDDARSVLGAMVQRANRSLSTLGVAPDRLRDLVVEASIAQVEARTPQDQAKVVRVLLNRLARNMPLQLDSTVSYATNTTSVTTTARQRAVSSPYNTYRRPGLPAGPISNPGEGALRAAVAPDDGTWLYFVTVNPDTGETRFATTEAQHQANVALFQKWLREHPRG